MPVMNTDNFMAISAKEKRKKGEREGGGREGGEREEEKKQQTSVFGDAVGKIVFQDCWDIR